MLKAICSCVVVSCVCVLLVIKIVFALALAMITCRAADFAAVLRHLVFLVQLMLL